MKLTAEMAAMTVDLRVYCLRARARADQARLAVVAKGTGRNGTAGHVVIDGKADVGVAADRLQGVEWPDLAFRQTHRTLAVEADGIDLRGSRPDQHHGVQIGGLQRQGVALVLEQHGRLFSGLLNDRGVLFHRLRGDLVFGEGRTDSRSGRSHRAHVRRHG